MMCADTPPPSAALCVLTPLALPTLLCTSLCVCVNVCVSYPASRWLPPTLVTLMPWGWLLRHA